MTTGFEASAAHASLVTPSKRLRVASVYPSLDRKKDRSAYYVASPLGVFYLAWFPSSATTRWSYP
jgi:hypothetical protein